MLDACSLDLRMLDAEGKIASEIKDFVEDSGLGNFLAPDQLDVSQALILNITLLTYIT